VTNFANNDLRPLTFIEIDAVTGAAVVLPSLPRLNFSNDTGLALRNELVDFIKKTRTALPEAPAGASPSF
jgi:hypothetical protein